MIRTLLFLSTAAAVFAQSPCENLKSLHLSTMTITKAETVPAGAFRPEGQPPEADQAKAKANAKGKGGGQAAALQVPAFCRVAATLAPSSDSSIDVEVWLPSNWNGKYEAVGGGGWA